MLWQEPSVSFSWDSQVCMLYMSFMWRDAFRGGGHKNATNPFPPFQVLLGSQWWEKDCNNIDTRQQQQMASDNSRASAIARTSLEGNSVTADGSTEGIVNWFSSTASRHSGGFAAAIFGEPPSPCFVARERQMESDNQPGQLQQKKRENGVTLPSPGSAAVGAVVALQ